MTEQRSRALRPAFVVAVGLVLAGCGPGAEQESAAAAARDFLAAAGRQDGPAACELLSPAARKSLETSDSPCATEIVGLGLRERGVPSVSVWGDSAVARFTGDTVFLQKFPAGWRVTGAGCRPQADHPYDCDVEG